MRRLRRYLLGMDAVAAVEENLCSMWSQLGRAKGCALHDEGDALWVETPMPVLPYNMVLRYRGDAPSAPSIDAIFQRYADAGVPFLWFVHPSATPADIDAQLVERGLAESEVLAGMTADLAELPAEDELPTDVELVEVTPDRAFPPFLEFVANRWQVPSSARSKLLDFADVLRFGAPGSPNRAWLAMKEGTPVAKCVTHDSEAAVGVYGMVTQPEARGLGLGRRVCIEALAAARGRGRTRAVLHSTTMARSLYASVGFRDVAPFRVFAEPGTFHA